MSTTRYDCAEPFYPPPGTGTIVGSGQIWGDDSDSTYADSASITGADWPCAYLADTVPIPAIDSLTIHLRAALISGDDARVGVYAGTTVGLGDNDLVALDDSDTTPLEITGTPTDYVLTSPNPSVFTNVLTGAWFVTVVGLGATALRVYELWFDVSAHSNASPLRQYPPNGNGRGPKRMYPRTVNRRAGKSY